MVRDAVRSEVVSGEIPCFKRQNREIREFKQKNSPAPKLAEPTLTRNMRKLAALITLENVFPCYCQNREFKSLQQAPKPPSPQANTSACFWRGISLG